NPRTPVEAGKNLLPASVDEWRNEGGASMGLRRQSFEAGDWHDRAVVEFAPGLCGGQANAQAGKGPWAGGHSEDIHVRDAGLRRAKATFDGRKQPSGVVLGRIVGSRGQNSSVPEDSDTSARIACI